MALHLVLVIQLFYFVFAQEQCCCSLLGHSFVFHYITDKSQHIELVEFFLKNSFYKVQLREPETHIFIELVKKTHCSELISYSGTIQLLQASFLRMKRYIMIYCKDYGGRLVCIRDITLTEKHQKNVLVSMQFQSSVYGTKHPGELITFLLIFFVSFLNPREICVQEGISHPYTELHKVSLETPPNTLIFLSSSSVSIF